MILPFPAFTESTQSYELIANRIKGALFEQFYQYQESRNKMFTRVQIYCIIQAMEMKWYTNQSQNISRVLV